MAAAVSCAELHICPASCIQLCGMGPDQQPDTAGLSLNGVLGYVFGGCLLQLLKEKSGSIWLPVLVHCLADYSIILKY